MKTQPKRGIPASQTACALPAVFGFSLAIAAIAAVPGKAIAQQGGQEIQEVVVTGTRSTIQKSIEL